MLVNLTLARSVTKVKVVGQSSGPQNETTATALASADRAVNVYTAGALW